MQRQLMNSSFIFCFCCCCTVKRNWWKYWRFHHFNILYQYHSVFVCAAHWTSAFHSIKTAVWIWSATVAKSSTLPMPIEIRNATKYKKRKKENETAYDRPTSLCSFSSSSSGCGERRHQQQNDSSVKWNIIIILNIACSDGYIERIPTSSTLDKLCVLTVWLNRTEYVRRWPYLHIKCDDFVCGTHGTLIEEFALHIARSEKERERERARTRNVILWTRDGSLSFDTEINDEKKANGECSFCFYRCSATVEHGSLEYPCKY